MDIPSIARFAQIKGLNLVGTGDFTHPQWLGELRDYLVEDGDGGLYKPRSNPESEVRFMVTAEVCTVFGFEGRMRRIHHVILTPSLEVAGQINDRLTLYGDLTVDGRPVLNVSAPELVEEVIGVSRGNVVFPAHAWTPWFSVFGSFSGFDRMEDCYQDMTRHIFALETGLSSDPPMNWRLSALDRYALVSNSDSHSPYPYRMGREANVFDAERPTYSAIVDSIRQKDPKRFRFTIETDPAYGKYHWTGHRNCKVSMPPSECRRLGGRCPVCGRPLTRGVEERVEELADRPEGFKLKGAIGFIDLLPLQEIVSAVLGVGSPSASKTWRVYNDLISRFGDEYTVLLDAEEEKLAQVVDAKIAEAVVKVRAGGVKVVPGYDGVYGKLILFDEEEEMAQAEAVREAGKQLGLDRFM